MSDERTHYSQLTTQSSPLLLSRPQVIGLCVKLATLFQVFHKAVYALQLARDVYLLRTLAQALAAVDAVIGLSEPFHGTVVAHKEGTLLLSKVGSSC